MRIKVKTLTGKEIELDIEEGQNIEEVKAKVEEQTGVPPVQQRLIFGGRQLRDETDIQASGITAGSILHLVLALRGGM